MTDRPPVTRHTLPSQPECTFSCPECGEEIEYADGLSCAPCGLYWPTPSDDAELDDEWLDFGATIAPDATAENPTHLMIYQEPGGFVAEAWIVHVGCPKDHANSTATCAFGEVISSGRLRILEPLDIAPGVPYGHARSYSWKGREEIRVLPTGVYTVESTGLKLVPLRVTALLALGGGEHCQDLSVFSLVDPRTTVPTFSRATRVDSGDPTVLDGMPGVCAFYENR